MQTSKYPTKIWAALYKSSIRPHLNYGDIVHDQAYNAPFHQKLVRCLSRNNRSNKRHFKGKIYEELSLESLQLCCWFRKLSCFYKLFNGKHPHCLFKLIPSRSSSYATRNIRIIPVFKTRHTFFKNSFTQFVIFNPCKVWWNWIAFCQNSFGISPGFLYQLIIRDTGRLANEAFANVKFYCFFERTA